MVETLAHKGEDLFWLFISLPFLARTSSTFFSQSQRKDHDAEVGHQCEWDVEKFHRCEETSGLEADHVQPVSKGGETVAENMEWLCLRHHAEKHDLDEEHYAAKTIRGRAK